MTTKINLPSSIPHPEAFVVAYVFATIDSKEYSWAITRSEFDSLPWAITDTSDGSDNSRDYATRFEFAILNAIRSLHHIRIVKPSIYLVDPPIDFDMNWLHGYEFTILEIDPQGEITAKDVHLPTLDDSDEDDSVESVESDEPVVVAEIIEPVAAEEVAPAIEITTQGEITESDVNFTDGEWDTTPTPDGSNSGNTPDGYNTLKSAVSAHFNAAKAVKSFQAYYLAFYRKLAKSNTCTLDICESVVTITRLANGTFEVSVQSQPVAPVSEMPVSDWHTIIDEIAIGDFNLIDSREWADHISESEIIFDQMIEAERDAMAIEDYEAEQAIERKNKPNTPSFEILATKQPAKAKRAGRAKFVQMTGMLFDTPKVSTTDLIARRAAQRKDLGDRMPPAPLFRGI